MHEFFLPMIPPTVTAQEQKTVVRNGKPFRYDPAEVRAAKQKILDTVAQHRPEHPLTGPVTLLVTWCFPLDKGGAHRDGDPKITKPDTDNLQKMLKDCMTKAGFWIDDAQVYMEYIGKFWSDTPGIYIAYHEGGEHESQRSESNL